MTDWSARAPCGNCPYRKDAPLGLWDAAEFTDLLRAHRDELRGAMYWCHKGRTKSDEERPICVGWLITQRDNGIPSLQLRLTLMRNDAAVACYKEASAGEVELYQSVEEMVEANLGAMARAPRRGGP